MKQYTDSQIIDKVQEIGGFFFDGRYTMVGIQSQADRFNMFDDKFYIYDGYEFKMVTTGTTNPGAEVLLKYELYNLPGAAVWKLNQFYRGIYEPGLHKGKMKALRQVEPIYYYRDTNKNQLSEEIGKVQYGLIGANNHGVSYDPFSNKEIMLINSWSFGCQVMNRMSDYRNWINAAWKRNRSVSYAILKEW